MFFVTIRIGDIHLRPIIMVRHVHIITVNNITFFAATTDNDTLSVWLRNKYVSVCVFYGKPSADIHKPRCCQIGTPNGAVILGKVIPAALDTIGMTVAPDILHWPVYIGDSPISISPRCIVVIPRRTDVITTFRNTIHCRLNRNKIKTHNHSYRRNYEKHMLFHNNAILEP